MTGAQTDQAPVSRLMDGIREMEIERRRIGAASAVANDRARPPSPISVIQARWSDSELLARILDGVADGIAAHDASGQLIFINDAGARMCGYESASRGTDRAL